MVGMGGGLGGGEFAPGSDLPPGVTPDMVRQKQQRITNPTLLKVAQEMGYDPSTQDAGSFINSLTTTIQPQQVQTFEQRLNEAFPVTAVDPTAIARPSFRERRAARPSFRERRAPIRTQRQAYRQLGGRPVMDWIIGGGDKQWSNKADRRSFFKNVGLRLAGIMNPALAGPIFGYQMYEGMKDLNPSERKQFLAKNLMGGALGRRFGPGAQALGGIMATRGLSRPDKMKFLAQNLMFGGLGRRFGPGAQALGGIMALRRGAPAKSLLPNLLAANAPRGYRDIAGGIAGVMGGKRTWGQAARNVGRGRTYGYLRQQIGNQLFEKGVNPQYIPMMASEMAKRTTQGLGKAGPWKP
jgi:hypothetical protein